MNKEFWTEKYRKESGKNWNLFYKRNSTNFYKDRHWTHKEFSQLLEPNIVLFFKKFQTLLEIGCGVGNFLLPLLEVNPTCILYGVDISHHAISLFKQKEYDTRRCTVSQCDIVLNAPEYFNVDFISLVFVLSSIHPNDFSAALLNLKKCLKKGGVVLFRDYGADDMAKYRFKEDRILSDNLFVRQDGTFTQYFEFKDLESLFISAGFKTKTFSVVEKEIHNRKDEVSMKRKFLQAEFILE